MVFYSLPPPKWVAHLTGKSFLSPHPKPSGLTSTPPKCELIPFLGKSDYKIIPLSSNLVGTQGSKFNHVIYLKKYCYTEPQTARK